MNNNAEVVNNPPLAQALSRQPIAYHTVGVLRSESNSSGMGVFLCSSKGWFALSVLSGSTVNPCLTGDYGLLLVRLYFACQSGF